MRILLLMQFFDPEPTLKGLTFARELMKLGHEVDVLTAFPNYPGGKVYPGYRIKPWQREEIDGVRVTRVWLYPSHDLSPVRRVLNYLSFALSAAVLGPWLVRRPDAMYVYHPPPTISIAANVLRWHFGAPYVYDVQDIWPDTVAASGMMSHRTLLRVLEAWCRRVYAGADHLAVISPGFRRLLTGRGVHEERIDVIYNWCDEARMRVAPRNPALGEDLGFTGRFNVVFAGTMGLAQALDPVLDAAALLRETHPAAQFVFIGGGVDRERLQRRAAEMELPNVRFIAAQPLARMGEILPLADALLVHLKDDPLFAITVPSKTQAYLFAGVPIIMAVRGDAAALVRESGAGVTCAPGVAREIASAVAELMALSPEERAAMGARGRAAYMSRLSLEVGVARFESILRDLAGRADDPPARPRSRSVAQTSGPAQV